MGAARGAHAQRRRPLTGTLSGTRTNINSYFTASFAMLKYSNIQTAHLSPLLAAARHPKWKSSVRAYDKGNCTRLLTQNDVEISLDAVRAAAPRRRL
ncbi:hypothetical protein EVAR_68907_1 [Eumeta japonica]|uniref:Uncharacterized protein n=1 Tax=Eumeta variegata TaxID=151549 RepID=A0A4C1ZRF8_EUMVA|nr:hypothetical protein EVAR_68907_1 [Eumeta japonica]